MAVYTPLAESDIRTFLSRYALGELVSYHGIAEGVENSNFLLLTATGHYILTLFEKRTRAEELPYFMNLTAHLSAKGLYVPLPVADRTGAALQTLKGKPACIVTFLEGKGATGITLRHVELLGAYAARMHLAASDFSGVRANGLALKGWHALVQKIGDKAEAIAPGLPALIAAELAWLSAHWPKHLPHGAVHADLFPDNVFFSTSLSPLQEEGGMSVLSSHANAEPLMPQGGVTPHPAPLPERESGIGQDTLHITGVIDFYFACTEYWMYDLAICLNAWCYDNNHIFQPAFARALCDAYQCVRPFTPQERAAFPVLARGAALRFLLTRTHDWVFHPSQALVTPKDPREYLAKLHFFRSVTQSEEIGA